PNAQRDERSESQALHGRKSLDEPVEKRDELCSKRASHAREQAERILGGNDPERGSVRPPAKPRVFNIGLIHSFFGYECRTNLRVQPLDFRAKRGYVCQESSVRAKVAPA